MWCYIVDRFTAHVQSLCSESRQIAQVGTFIWSGFSSLHVYVFTALTERRAPLLWSRSVFEFHAERAQRMWKPFVSFGLRAGSESRKHILCEETEALKDLNSVCDREQVSVQQRTCVVCILRKADDDNKQIQTKEPDSHPGEQMWLQVKLEVKVC